MASRSAVSWRRCAAATSEVGGRLLEFGGTEYMVRGRGYATSIEEFKNIVLDASADGTPIRIKDIGQVVEGPDLRRGVADLDGKGEVVSGIVIMRSGENALDGDRPRQTENFNDIEPTLPEGVKIVPIYDRSQLIHRAISNVESTILEVVVTVVLIILIFLWHFPSAAIPIVTMPVVVLVSFIPFRLMGISANIMSLAGVAIAFGELVDASIVVVEQTHKKLELWERGGRRGDYRDVVIAAVKEVAGPTFFALLVIAISFLPVLTLEGAGRPHVQAPGLHQDPGHDRRRGTGHHARSGAAPAAHSRRAVRLPPGVALPGGQCLAGGQDSLRRKITPSAAG